jgi:hypothetical protein
MGAVVTDGQLERAPGRMVCAHGRLAIRSGSPA